MKLIIILLIFSRTSVGFLEKCDYYTTEIGDSITCQIVNIVIPAVRTNLEFDLNGANVTWINGLDLVTMAGTLGFTTVPTEIFTTFPNIENIFLRGNIKIVSSNDFQNAINLKNLNLNYNNLTNLQSNTFSTLRKLNTLSLKSNELAVIQPGAFNGLGELNTISLECNQLTIIRQGTFVEMNSLDRLYLNENLIEIIEDGAFDLFELKFLGLASNRLKTLSDSVFCQLPSLYSLGLTFNKLTHIGKALHGLENLCFLSLDNNTIEDIDLSEFARLARIRYIFLANSGFSFKPQQYTNETVTNESLKFLGLSNNNLTNPDDLKQLSIFRGLEALELNENPYTDLDLDSIKIEMFLPKLNTINLERTNISCNDIVTIGKQLTERYTSIRVKFCNENCE